jgi:hypothetical protein
VILSLISKICHITIFGYKYGAIIYQILDNQERSCSCVIHWIQIRSEVLNQNVGRFVEMLLCKYKLFSSTKIGDPLNRNTQIFQETSSHLQILAVKAVQWSNPRTQNPQIWSKLFTSMLFVVLFSVRLNWYLSLYWNIYAENINRRPYETYSPRRKGTQDLNTLSATYSQKHWQYGIPPLLGIGAKLGLFFKVEAWIM